MDEFEIISRFFAPLAGPGGLGLTDDAACLTLEPGRDLVLSADALVAGVHFRPGDPPDLIARKALRVNLSDLAAKGAVPLGYLLTVAWPLGTAPDWIARFAAGLAEDQDRFACPLLGGDTVSTGGPLTLSVTVLGSVPAGAMLRRSGARIGDAVFVTGTIGDGALGLHYPILDHRYLLPEPRLDIGRQLIGRAHAAMDVSDGLVADLRHMIQASGVAAELDVAAIPLSKEAKALISADKELLKTVITGGDDYEILFTGPSDLGSFGTRIGTISAGTGLTVPGMPDLGTGGWRHKVMP